MKYLLSFVSSVLIAAVLVTLAPVHGEHQIYEDVLRLHVIAESDSDEDQALKLKVRDAVLDCVSSGVGNCSDIYEAYDTVEKMLGEIEDSARGCVAENGKSCSVTVTLGEENYPRRDYGETILPAGKYKSLRVILGDGEGHNWWCVLFPSVCMKFASPDEYAEASLTPAEYKLITRQSGKVKVRFRILEILEEITGKPLKRTLV